MRTPDAVQLLDVWERGQRQPPPARAVTLLAAAGDSASEDVLLMLPVGRADALLLELRERLFGPRMPVVVRCPSCAGLMEADIATTDLLVSDGNETVLMVEHGGFQATVRTPTSGDLIAIASGTREDARAALLRRCVLTLAGPDARENPAEELSSDLADAIVTAMAAADPQADIQLELSCPECSHAWTAPLDIAAYLWREIDGWAHRTFADVHALARAYGWREHDVLALSPTRRQIYLELARQ